MVLTRSRAASPAPPAAQSEDLAPPLAPAPDSYPRGAAPAPMANAAAGSAPVAMTTDQLLLLIDRLSSHRDPVSTPVHSGHFAKCTARFDGNKASDVLAFIDAVETYKECVRVDDANALRGLPMLLTGLAATWWQGVKETTYTWHDAVEALKATFGPRLPPHKIFRKIFEREQRPDESTDIFVCHVRALIAQLPPSSLSEVVQLDMVYGLLQRRIREKVARTSFGTFAELVAEARRVEDILDEGRPRPAAAEVKPLTSAAATPSSFARSPASVTKARPHCNYCKQFGHLKEACQKLAKQKAAAVKEKASSAPASTPTITCFGCGAPGVIRWNCSTCKEKKSVVSSSVFQSVSASDTRLDSRVRPVLEVEVYGVTGRLVLDTGAKHCIGSVSLRSHLVSNGQTFCNVFTELKYADGRVCAQNVEIAQVNVTVRGVTLNVSFLMLPNAKDSLLGMNFIQDAGMVLDFCRGEWYLRDNRAPQPIIYESSALSLSSSSVGLREDEGSHLHANDRLRLSDLLNVNEDIFPPGGGPTDFAVHRIDTGDATPIASLKPESPAKKEIIIKPDPVKVQAVIGMKPPTNFKELKTFLQTCSWFRKFIPQFSEVARPLTDLTKKDRRWRWGESERNAFEELKVRLSTSPILRQPNFEEPFVLRTDASAYAVGAVLMQGETAQEERPIEYASRLLTPAERNYHTTEREALAVVWALDKFRGYIEGAEVRVATDHQPLKWLLSLKTPSGRLARWAMKIQSFNLDIHYTPGRVNVIADTLSRPVTRDSDELSSDASNTCSISPVVVDLPRRSSEDIRDAQLNDPDVCKIIQDFENFDSPDSALRWTDRGYYLSQGELYRWYSDGESVADKGRRVGTRYTVGDLVLVESHRLSQASKGFTSKFAPRREGPYTIKSVVSPTTFEVVDKNDLPRGRYHASLLTPYVGSGEAVVHTRRRGRPRKVIGSKSVPEPSTDLEGEDVARQSLDKSNLGIARAPSESSPLGARKTRTIWF